ncbi:hypothetical protein QBA75_37490 [Streptomyces stelliscabiei]
MATRTTVRRWRRNPSLLAGAVILGLLLVVALVAPLVLSGSAETLTDNARLGPGAEHLLGTDAFGRDVLARALVATRLTLLMAAAATAASFVVGVAIGALVHLAPGGCARPVCGSSTRRWPSPRSCSPWSSRRCSDRARGPRSSRSPSPASPGSPG